MSHPKLTYHCICGHAKHEHEPDCCFCQCDGYQPLIHPAAQEAPAPAPPVTPQEEPTRSALEVTWTPPPAHPPHLPTPQQWREHAQWLGTLGGKAAAIGEDLRKLAEWMDSVLAQAVADEIQKISDREDGA